MPGTAQAPFIPLFCLLLALFGGAVRGQEDPENARPAENAEDAAPDEAALPPPPPEVRAVAFLRPVFQDAELPEKVPGKLDAKSLPAYLRTLPAVQAAMREEAPCLLYTFTKATRTVRARGESREVPTREAEASIRVGETLLGGDSLKFAVASRFFHCHRIDVTAVDKEANNVFCSVQAPLLLVIDTDGSMATALRGKMLEEDRIFDALDAFLKKKDIHARRVLRDAEDGVRELRGAHRDLDRARVKLASREAALADFTAHDKWAHPKRFERAQEACDDEAKTIQRLAHTIRALEGEVLEAFAAELAQDTDE